LNPGKSIERVSHVSENLRRALFFLRRPQVDGYSANDLPLGLSLTQAIQRYARLGSEAAEVSSASDEPGETLPPKPYD
jgi:hypothetical protein